MNEHEAVEQALATLRRVGLDPSAVVQQWRQRLDEQENRMMPPKDAKYTIPTEAPRVTDHFVEGNGRPAALAPHIMWAGYHYTLTPGQRRWFREVAGMTPAETVTVAWVEVWPRTQHPHSFKIVSDRHLDNRLRRRVINEWVIRSAEEFFTLATAFDLEGEADLAEDSDDAPKAKARKMSTAKVPKNVENDPLYHSMLAGLEADAGKNLP